VRICQIESRNPHLHADKGEAHVSDMVKVSLAAIYHSRLCPDWLKEEIVTALRHAGYLESGEELAPVRIYPSLQQLSLSRFADTASEVLARRSGTSVEPGRAPAV
jgi:mannosyl-3-phosphoglycerate synthase